MREVQTGENKTRQNEKMAHLGRHQSIFLGARAGVCGAGRGRAVHVDVSGALILAQEVLEVDRCDN